jgi:hypothetical protein
MLERVWAARPSQRGVLCSQGSAATLNSSTSEKTIEMKTIKELNNRWWYRLLKSVYVISFVVIAIFAAWDTYVNNQPVTISENTWINPQGPLNLLTNVTSTHVTMGSTTNAILYSILAFVIVACIFEAVRRVFYYIVTGSMRSNTG